MARFYGNLASIGCGNGCNGRTQVYYFDEDGNPTDPNWDEWRRVYDLHNSICTPGNPFTTDSNSYYGNPDDCMAEPGYCVY